MHPESNLTPDKLAATGRALYGERWQAPLATDLQVAERTVRRWLAGEAPIPKPIDHELREMLIKRLDQIGGMIRYSVNPTERTVFHHPTAACFHYDSAGSLTLLNPEMVRSGDLNLIMHGAEEALRQERERDPRIKFIWLNHGREGGASATIELDYGGCIITYPRIRRDSSRWTVNLASNDPGLLAKLGGNVVIDDFESLESAIAKAKRWIDALN